MSLHQMPTDSEIRQRIENVKKERYRLAFKFQYLIAGRISEVCGQYSPKGDDAIVTDFDGETAILFIVKTAKRGGRLRPVAIPLRYDYEPWTDEVRQYFHNHRGEFPFRFADKWATSIRYMQWEAEKAFKDLEWPMVAYSKSAELELEPQQVLGEGINQKNQEVYKVLLPDGEVIWLPKIGENRVRTTKKIKSRWKDMTSHVLRKRRTITLMLDYDFDHIDLSLYGGWTIAQSSEGVPQALKNYLYVEPQSSQEPAKLLKKLAGRYFHKLCKEVSR